MWLALLAWWPAGPQSTPTSLRGNEILEILIDPDAPPLEGFGPARRFDAAASSNSTLYLWAASDDAEIRLTVQDSYGHPLGTADGSPKRDAAFLRIPSPPSGTLRVLVGARTSGGASRARLGFFAPRTIAAEDLPVIASAKASLGEARAQAASGAPEASLASAAKSVGLLLDLGRRQGPEALWSDELVAALADAGATSMGLWDAKDAAEAYEEVLRFRERVLPPAHRELLHARILFASQLKSLGEPRRARDLEEGVFEICNRTLADDYPLTQQVRENLAITLCMLGDLRRGRDLQEAALEIYARSTPADDRDLLRAEMNLGVTVKDLGDLPRARDLQERVYAILAGKLPDEDRMLQAVRMNLANTVAGLGDLLRARELEEKVLEVFSRTLDPDDLELQGARGNLAFTLFGLGEVTEARKLLDAELAVLSRTLSPDDRELQQVRGNLGILLRRSGDLRGARAIFEQVLAELARTLPPWHPDIQATKSSIAEILAASGARAEACELLLQVLAVRERDLPDDHAELLGTRRLLAAVFAADDDRAAALEIGRGIADSLGRAVRGWMLSQSPREVEEQAVQQRGTISFILSLSDGAGTRAPDREIESQAMSVVESFRGVGLRSALLLREARGEPGTSGLFDDVRARRDELVRLVRLGASRDEIADVRGRSEAAERALVASLSRRPGFEGILVEPDVGTLAAHLPPCTAMVGFWRYTRFGSDWNADDPDHLAAFVVGEGGTLAQIDLGPVGAIERATEDWLDAVVGERGAAAGRGVGPHGRSPEGSEREAGLRLSRLVVRPLEPAIGGAERLVLAPDDVLHAVPLDALPDPDALDGSPAPRLVGERWCVETRATLWEILHRAQAPAGTKVVLFGGIDYDVASKLAAGAERTAGAPAYLRSGSSLASFKPLPATEREVGAIAALHREVAGTDGDLELRTGPAASRDALVELAPRSHWLHLATHGWFAPGSVPSSLDAKGVDARTGLGPAMSREVQVRGTSPMILCGLALAGANREAYLTSGIAGMITAEELAALDLSGCELAVLSACDTSVGVRRAGQGVASLQRALQMSGARSVITSLWKVPDEPTTELMTDFYRRLWIDEKPKQQALWESKMKLRNAVGRAGAPLYATRDWAGWVLTGEPD